MGFFDDVGRIARNPLGVVGDAIGNMSGDDFEDAFGDIANAFTFLPNPINSALHGGRLIKREIDKDVGKNAVDPLSGRPPNRDDVIQNVLMAQIEAISKRKGRTLGMGTAQGSEPTLASTSLFGF